MVFSEIVAYAVLLVAGYLIGSIPFGYLIGKFNGVDVRKAGSGNIGATNVTRVVGPRAGKLCFVLDALKGALPVVLAKIAVAQGWLPAGGLTDGIALLSGILGHMFTCFLHFKGGKGIATAVGALAAITPWAALSAFIVWVVVFKLSGYVSLGSIIAAAALPFLAWGFSAYNLPHLSCGMLIFFAVLAVAAILKHKSNIQRLLNGTENRFKK